MADSTSREWMNPATLKGAVFVVASLVVITMPDLSLTLLRLILAVVITVSGASGLWGFIRRRGNKHEALRAVVELMAGIGLFVTPVLTEKGILLAIVGYLAFVGGLDVFRAYTLSRSGENYHLEITRGALSLCFAVVTFTLPEAVVYIGVVFAAGVVLAAGLVMLSYGMTHKSSEISVVNRPLVINIFATWIRDRDVGCQRRGEVADSLFFEAPDRAHKIVSYIVMLLLSVTIASLAILQDSTAVVIGAMLVAPLMTPIMGCAAGLVAGWRQRAMTSLAVVAASVVAAVGLAWTIASWIPALVPLTLNTQVLSRSAPTLLDMAIAVAAGAAGAYATIDDRVSSSLTGVAVAVALVPPLGVVGIALQAGQWSDAFGSFLLFGTNLVSIILASVVVFLLVGFTPAGELIKNRAAIGDLLATVVVMALLITIPLGLSGEGVLKRASRRAYAQDHAEAWIKPVSSLRLVKVGIQADEVSIILSGTGEVPSLGDLEDAISKSFGVPTKVIVEVFPSRVISYSDADGTSEFSVVQSPTDKPALEAIQEEPTDRSEE